MNNLDILIEWIRKNKQHKYPYSSDGKDKEKYVIDYDDLLAKIIYLKNNG